MTAKLRERTDDSNQRTGRSNELTVFFEQRDGLGAQRLLHEAVLPVRSPSDSLAPVAMHERRVWCDVVHVHASGPSGSDVQRGDQGRRCQVPPGGPAARRDDEVHPPGVETEPGIHIHARWIGMRTTEFAHASSNDGLHEPVANARDAATVPYAPGCLCNASVYVGTAPSAGTTPAAIVTQRRTAGRRRETSKEITSK